MPIVYVKTYRLAELKLKEFLQSQFPGEVIKITIGETVYAIALSQNLSQEQYDAIDELRARRRRNV
ncbi:hypothetical protein GGR51DRAFT_520492 [Nemania sp. FL0031]|nr:hypothetical protein GGR51DRAFT_520492 [Nemania sp. FL0031]